ncbi:MAG: hypothetical protein ACK4WH_08335 [Phycisphaerales bacterium]
MLDLLSWGEQHSDLWVANAAAIGLTNAQATAFKGAYTQAKALYSAQLAARDAWRASVASQNDAVREFRRISGDTVLLIKAFAENQPDPTAVYNTAAIPAPGSPSPLPPPGQPTDFTASLDSTGAVRLRWRCENPGGQTVYIVRRALGGAGAFNFIGVAGSREFYDAAIPAGVSTVTYQITAQRGQVSGTPGYPFIIMFGSAGGGAGGGAGGLFIAEQHALTEHPDGTAKIAA